MLTTLYRTLFGQPTADQFYDRKFPELGGRSGTVVDGYDLPNPSMFPSNTRQLSKVSTKARFRASTELADDVLRDCDTQQQLRNFYASLRRHTYEEHPCLSVESMYADCNDVMLERDTYYADQLLDNVLQFKGIPRCSRDKYSPTVWHKGNPVNNYTPEEYRHAYDNP